MPIHPQQQEGIRSMGGGDGKEKSKWSQAVPRRRIVVPAAIGIVGLVLGYLAGRWVEIPGDTQWWDIAAQPIATFLAGVGAIGAGYLAFRNGEKSRALDTQHHKETTEGGRESGLRDRYTTAAGQLADDSPAIREAGTYALAALGDDWLRFGDSTGRTDLAFAEIQVCLNLLSSYLRANRQMIEETPTGVQAFNRDEFSVRRSIIRVLGDRNAQWRALVDVWVEAGRLPPDTKHLMIDLEGANLATMHLAGIDLSRQNLSRVNLSGADLFGAKLSGANLQSADLTGRANLHRADLSEAALVHTDLTGARLERTKLTGSLTFGMNISGADVSKADWNLGALPEQTIRYMVWSSKTLWPEGFTPPRTKDEDQAEQF
ncbi:pentapeptide repeat-containing protein [Rhodococcus sp. NPDC059968]|uniref:pentapeptide repeat-containing protein n=1 Tax=Rhodococcus sp. NPDC059968 TaxID=3347017 RepID=UPI00366E5E28